MACNVIYWAGKLSFDVMDVFCVAGGISLNIYGKEAANTAHTYPWKFVSVREKTRYSFIF